LDLTGSTQDALRKRSGSELPKSGSALMDFGSSLWVQRFLMGREHVFAPQSELLKSRRALPSQLPERTRFERDSEAEVGGGALLVTLL